MPFSSLLKNEGKRKVIVDFSIFSVGVFLNFAGFVVLLGLQSSINIEDGAGVASVTAAYTICSIFGITGTPVLLRIMGAKKSIIFCEILYFAYILLNIYPIFPTLITGGLLVGIGEAVMWPSCLFFSNFFARSFSQYAKESEDYYVAEFVGIFYMVFQASWVFGNLLNYSILFGGRSPITIQSGNTTVMTPIIRDLSICGANDCQDPNITDANLSRYEPASPILIYILIGVCAGMVLIAMVIQGFLVKPAVIGKEPKYSNVNREEKNNADESLVEHEKEESVFQTMLYTMKSAFSHLLIPKQILISPFAIYSGLVIYYAIGEIPRAYGSCMMGVEQVGLLAALCGGAGGLASYVTSKITSRFGRNTTMLVAFGFDIAFNCLCIFWIPTQDSLWVVYIIFIGCGIINGTWQPLINEVHAVYFPEKLEIALSVWNMYLEIGVAWQAGWSTAICMKYKMYFHVGFLCFCMFCYGLSQFIYYRKKENTDVDKEDNEDKML